MFRKEIIEETKSEMKNTRLAFNNIILANNYRARELLATCMHGFTFFLKSTATVEVHTLSQIRKAKQAIAFSLKSSSKIPAVHDNENRHFCFQADPKKVGNFRFL